MPIRRRRFFGRKTTIKPAIERFNKFIVKEQSGCWIFTGSISGGYGLFQGHDKRIKAHRFAYETFVGPIPEGFLVCHKCDVKRCVNPDHLFLGTNKDNTQDCIAKGRQFILPRPPQVKLTPEAVLDIRSRNDTAKALCSRYNICVATVYHIRRGLTWKHI